jgi:hypothetical protein
VPAEIELMTKNFFVLLFACLAVGPLGRCLAAERDEQDPTRADARAAAEQDPEALPTGKGMAGIQAAAKANKYLFALFVKEEDQRAKEMRDSLTAVLRKVADRAQSIEVDVTLDAEQDIVDRYGLRWTSMPLLLVIAPNGVVTAGFRTRVEEEQLLDAFVSPATAKLLKALDDRKLVFLCVQHAKSEQRKAAMRGVRKFKQHERFADGTEIVMVNPADKAEAELLADLEVDPQTRQAVTVFFGPGGRRIGEFHGKTDFDELVWTLHTSMSGFG